MGHPNYFYIQESLHVLLSHLHVYKKWAAKWNQMPSTSAKSWLNSVICMKERHPGHRWSNMNKSNGEITFLSSSFVYCLGLILIVLSISPVPLYEDCAAKYSLVVNSVQTSILTVSHVVTRKPARFQIVRCNWKLQKKHEHHKVGEWTSMLYLEEKTKGEHRKVDPFGQ